MSITVRAGGPELAGQNLAIGVGCEVAVLAALAGTVGVGPAGWAAGLAFALGMSGLLAIGLRRRAQRSLGPADQVTLARATLVGAVTALVADSYHRPAPAAVLVILATAALILDGVDGKVARRTGTSSPLGARFDMEVDAFLLLVLSVDVATRLGAWVLLIGVMRYAFVAAGWALPWLRAPLPSRMSGKTVAAIQGIVLVVAASGALPTPASIALVAAALTALTWSFARDVRWLARRATPVRADRSAIAPTEVSPIDPAALPQADLAASPRSASSRTDQATPLRVAASPRTASSLAGQPRGRGGRRAPAPGVIVAVTRPTRPDGTRRRRRPWSTRA